MEDKILIKKAQKGEKEAFGLLYQKYFQKIFRYCRINTNNDELAKDICQESFVKAYKKLSSFKTDGIWSFQAFLFAIARNQIIDISRKRKEANIEDYENLESNENLYDELERKNNINRIRTVLAKLDEMDRQIIVLRYLEELSSSEVAKILKINDGALRVRTFRVMQKVKDIFEGLYGKNN